LSRLAPKAVAALDDVLADKSELKELWQENEADFPAWLQLVQDIKRRLSPAV